MAFYKDFEKKTRQEKRDAAFSRGGYDDEGTGYSKKPSSRSACAPMPQEKGMKKARD